MDINVDQAEPRKDMILQEDGKYVFVDPANNKFDIDKFNRYYEQYRERRRADMQKKMLTKLEALNAPAPEIPVYKQSVPKIILDIKDSLFNLLDDLLQGKFEFDTFFKNNRLFYLGIALVFVGLFVYVYSILIDDEYENKTPKKIQVEFNLIE
jgi:hypothetical protein